MWGISFCIPNAVIWAMRGGDQITSRMLLATLPVFIWGSRLAIYIFLRKNGEDYRYKELRLGWEARGNCTYLVCAYIFVPIMQGILAIITNASVLFINLYSHRPESEPLIWSDFLGLAIWIIGFGIEVLADS